MGAAVASKSADTAAGTQRSPSFAQTSRPSRPARRTWPGMIEARLAPTRQSAPGTGRLQSLATAEARYGRIAGQHRARHPARVTPAPALHRPQADRGPSQQTAAPDRHRVLSPPQRQPGASRPGAQPASAALHTPSTKRSAAATSASAGLHTSADPTGTQNSPIWSPAAAKRPLAHGVHIGGSGVTAVSEPQSLSVIGTLACRVPDRRPGAWVLCRRRWRARADHLVVSRWEA